MTRGGQLIREGRRRAGLTQAALAARVGTTQSAVARWESGSAAPSLDTVVRVLRACELDLEVAVVPYDDSDYAQARRLLRLTPAQRAKRAVEVSRVYRDLRRQAERTARRADGR